MKIDVVTLFPEWFEWFGSQRHVANALAAGSSLTMINPRDHTPLGGRRRAGERQNGERGGETAADEQAHGRAPCAASTSPRRRARVKRAQLQASQPVPKASVTRVSGRPTLK